MERKIFGYGPDGMSSYSIQSLCWMNFVLIEIPKCLTGMYVWKFYVALYMYSPTTTTSQKYIHRICCGKEIKVLYSGEKLSVFRYPKCLEII